MSVAAPHLPFAPTVTKRTVAKCPLRGRPTLAENPGLHQCFQQCWDQKASGRTSLVVQWLRLRALDAGGQVQSLVRELDPTCMLQLRAHMPQLKILHVAMKIPHATTKTQHS